MDEDLLYKIYKGSRISEIGIENNDRKIENIFCQESKNGFVENKARSIAEIHNGQKEILAQVLKNCDYNTLILSNIISDNNKSSALLSDKCNISFSNDCAVKISKTNVRDNIHIKRENTFPNEKDLLLIRNKCDSDIYNITKCRKSNKLSNRTLQDFSEACFSNRQSYLKRKLEPIDKIETSLSGLKYTTKSKSLLQKSSKHFKSDNGVKMLEKCIKHWEVQPKFVDDRDSVKHNYNFRQMKNTQTQCSPIKIRVATNFGEDSVEYIDPTMEVEFDSAESDPEDPVEPNQQNGVDGTEQEQESAELNTEGSTMDVQNTAEENTANPQDEDLSTKNKDENIEMSNINESNSNNSTEQECFEQNVNKTLTDNQIHVEEQETETEEENSKINETEEKEKICSEDERHSSKPASSSFNALDNLQDISNSDQEMNTDLSKAEAETSEYENTIGRINERENCGELLTTEGIEKFTETMTLDSNTVSKPTIAEGTTAEKIADAQTLRHQIYSSDDECKKSADKRTATAKPGTPESVGNTESNKGDKFKEGKVQYSIEKETGKEEEDKKEVPEVLISDKASLGDTVIENEELLGDFRCEKTTDVEEPEQNKKMSESTQICESDDAELQTGIIDELKLHAINNSDEDKEEKESSLKQESKETNDNGIMEEETDIENGKNVEIDEEGDELEREDEMKNTCTDNNEIAENNKTTKINFLENGHLQQFENEENIEMMIDDEICESDQERSVVSEQQQNILARTSDTNVNIMVDSESISENQSTALAEDTDKEEKLYEDDEIVLDKDEKENNGDSKVADVKYTPGVICDEPVDNKNSVFTADEAENKEHFEKNIEFVKRDIEEIEEDTDIKERDDEVNNRSIENEEYEKNVKTEDNEIETAVDSEHSESMENMILESNEGVKNETSSVDEVLINNIEKIAIDKRIEHEGNDMCELGGKHSDNTFESQGKIDEMPKNLIEQDEKLSEPEFGENSSRQSVDNEEDSLEKDSIEYEDNSQKIRKQELGSEKCKGSVEKDDCEKEFRESSDKEKENKDVDCTKSVGSINEENTISEQKTKFIESVDYHAHQQIPSDESNLVDEKRKNQQEDHIGKKALSSEDEDLKETVSDSTEIIENIIENHIETSAISKSAKVVISGESVTDEIVTETAQDLTGEEKFPERKDSNTEGLRSEVIEVKNECCNNKTVEEINSRKGFEVKSDATESIPTESLLDLKVQKSTYSKNRKMCEDEKFVTFSISTQEAMSAEHSITDNETDKQKASETDNQTTSDSAKMLSPRKGIKVEEDEIETAISSVMFYDETSDENEQIKQTTTKSSVSCVENEYRVLQNASSHAGPSKELSQGTNDGNCLAKFEEELFSSHAANADKKKEPDGAKAQLSVSPKKRKKKRKTMRSRSVQKGGLAPGNLCCIPVFLLLNIPPLVYSFVD